MASFTISDATVRAHESGYVNHPSDRGGETYNGIARKFWPEWVGWPYIDMRKGADSFPNLADNEYLAPTVTMFYRNNFWHKIHGRQINSQLIATQVYDMAVNSGVKSSVKRLQKLLNLLNRQEKDYSDLTPDGIMGYITYSTLNNYLKLRSNGEYILGFYLIAELGHLWISLATSDETQEDFMNGWGKRGMTNAMLFAKQYLKGN